MARWISVDQNKEDDIQKYMISIVDHHVTSEIATKQEIPKTLELIGSCTALITQKLLGIGVNLDQKTAKILYGATLMDTENRVDHKMTPKDVTIMDYLKRLSKIDNDDDFYGALMSELLGTDDPEILFKRDYKQDWGFGFAVAKIKNGFDKNGSVLKKELVNKAINFAIEKNTNSNLPLTVLRITDYLNDSITVNRERVYLIFPQDTFPEFRKSIFDAMEKIIKFEFKDTNIVVKNDYIEFWGTGMQLSRKKTAPILEPIVKSYNEFFYSKKTNLWVKRDFLKRTKSVINAAKKTNFKISTDKDNRINYISFTEAQNLNKALNYKMLSIPEYWEVLDDAYEIKDTQMIESLQGSNFVEFWDSILVDNKLYNHPIVTNNGEAKGKPQAIKVPKGEPGLFHPNSVNRKTGMPQEVKGPDEYGNPNLWRYWAPDAKITCPTRSYIFLLKQPSWDGKFHLKDTLPNLGIRPCMEIIVLPRINTYIKNDRIIVKVEKEGETIKHIFK